LENRDDLQRDLTNTKPPAPKGETAPEPEEEQSLGRWLASNGFALLLMLIAIGYVVWNFDAEGIWSIVKALLGLSFVIFIHELGHFLVAKWCDVHVTTFSIGFGPAIPGCWFQWGETTYKLSILPLGGYVQMVGQVDGDEGGDGSEDDPRSYRNKSVGQRMMIISAGVVMNAILAFVCFIVVYQVNGKNRLAPVIGSVDSSLPAYQQGLRPGSEMLQIGDVKDPNFETLLKSVVFTGHGESVKIVAKRPEDAQAMTFIIEPRLQKDGIRPLIGAGPAEALELASPRRMGAGSSGPVVEDSPASRATPPFQFGDAIIATTDPDEPGKLKDLPRDARNPQKDQKDYFEFDRRMQRLAGQEVVVRVARTDADGKTENVDIRVPPAFHATFGVRMRMGQIQAVREGSPADKAGVHVPDKTKSLDGDVIFKIVLPEPGGKKPTVIDDKTLDPERLPFVLRQWADRVRRPDGRVAEKVTLGVHRHLNQNGQQIEDINLALDWDDSWRFDRIIPLYLSSPLAIPELGLAYKIKPIVAGVLPELIADNPLQVGDEIQELQVTYQVGKDRTKTNPSELKDNWASVDYSLNQSSIPITTVKLKIQRDKEVQTVEMTPAIDKSWPLAERGWIFMQDKRLKKADGIGEAIALGLGDTWDNMKQVGQMLYGIVTGRLSVKNLGGPITIAETAYHIAGYDIWEFIFFLGMVSINLAVINFLPIPVLDGGHMVFLVYERIFRRQAPESVRVGATYAGLAIILSLMIFVVYLDLTRH
jgi:regulator of sigma E protease